MALEILQAAQLRFLSPGAGTFNPTAGSPINIAWDTPFEFTTLEVWQGPSANGDYAIETLATGLPQNMTSYLWDASYISIPTLAPLHFRLQKTDTPNDCSGCVAETQDFSLADVNANGLVSSDSVATTGTTAAAAFPVFPTTTSATEASTTQAAAFPVFSTTSSSETAMASSTTQAAAFPVFPTSSSSSMEATSSAMATSTSASSEAAATTSASSMESSSSAAAAATTMMTSSTTSSAAAASSSSFTNPQGATVSGTDVIIPPHPGFDHKTQLGLGLGLGLGIPVVFAMMGLCLLCQKKKQRRKSDMEQFAHVKKPAEVVSATNPTSTNLWKGERAFC